MARTINEIYNSTLLEKQNHPGLDVLNSTSKTAIWRLLLYVVSVCIWAHEQVFDAHKKEVAQLIDEDKSHTPKWYRTKAKAFQFGFSLLTDSDIFNNGSASDDQVQQSKIVKYCAVGESSAESRLIIKIATESGGQLSPITAGQKLAFESYMKEIKDAGVKITVINYEADKLIFRLKIKRDANVLDQFGNSILNGNNPVKEVIAEYLKNLPFDGELVINSFIDRLQRIEGVINPSVMMMQTSWIDGSNGSYGNYQNISIAKIPESGYFKVDWNHPDNIIEYYV